MICGQMYQKKASNLALYNQLDICGLTYLDIIRKYPDYKNKKNILHGDWGKNKNINEHNLLNKKRQNEIIEILKELNQYIYGLTIHPPTKNRCCLGQFLDVVNYIQNKAETPVFIENRSSEKYLISTPESIFTILEQGFYMTIDVPQLFIHLGYSNNELQKVVKELNKYKNIKELHIGGVKNKRVAQKIDESNLIDYKEIYYFLQDRYVTFEILGGTKVFKESYLYLKNQGVNKRDGY